MNKYFRSLCLIIIIGLIVFPSCDNKKTEKEMSSNKNILKFNAQGQFKIAQFTDIHWDNNSKNCPKVIASIKHILETEKPDVAILTGDVVTVAPVVEGWFAIAKIFEEAKTPWAVILGNHDAEPGITRSAIFDTIANLPYFIGERGPKELYGAGNYALPVYDNKGEKIKSVLYCIDSNDYSPNRNFGHYDWIHFNQIEWYRNMSKDYTSLNGGTPIPSLAFMHIPVQEYNNIVGRQTTVGIKGEDVACSNINSGFFASLLEVGDVIGVFSGHDHDNDYIGIEKGIALAYGRRSGLDTYGDLEIGGRIILLYEGKHKFDTWIQTQSKGADTYYYYPAGVSSVDEKNMSVLPKTRFEEEPDKQGVSYKYYKGKFDNVADMSKDRPLRTGYLKNFDTPEELVGNFTGFEYNAWIKIPETGVYNFYTISDDGSVLYIDEQKIVDNDGLHVDQRKEGKVYLEAGFHKLKLLYFISYVGLKLEVGYVSKNIPETKLPDNILYLR